MDVHQVNREIEARFLEINKKELIKKLQLLKAEDLGEDLLKEVIFYDPERQWLEEKKVVRIRQQRDGIFLAFKHSLDHVVSGTKEIEFQIGDVGKATEFLELLGLKAFRMQEKKRHTFLFDSVAVDIDEHPGVPTYVEIEGPSQTVIKDAARALELDWSQAHFESTLEIIEQIYKIPLSTLSLYTFNKIE